MDDKKNKQVASFANKTASQQDRFGWFKILLGVARYICAILVTSSITAILPIIAIIGLAFAFALWILGVWLSFFMGASIDGGALQLIFWFIVAPISLLLGTIVSLILIALLSSIFVAVSVIPISLAVEFVFRRDAPSFNSFLKRLVTFAGAALIQASLVSGAIGYLEIGYSPDMKKALLVAIFFISGFVVFVSGSMLTLMHAIIGLITTAFGRRIAKSENTA